MGLAGMPAYAVPIMPDVTAMIPTPKDTAKRCFSFPKFPIRVMRTDGHARTKAIARKNISGATMCIRLLGNTSMPS